MIGIVAKCARHLYFSCIIRENLVIILRDSFTDGNSFSSIRNSSYDEFASYSRVKYASLIIRSSSMENRCS